MFALLDAMMDRHWRNRPPPIDSETVPTQPPSQWIVDLPLRPAIRLGPFRTRADALDYQLDYLIRQFEEADLTELPF
jgi:hypothetical protein